MMTSTSFLSLTCWKHLPSLSQSPVNEREIKHVNRSPCSCRSVHHAACALLPPPSLLSSLLLPLSPSPPPSHLAEPPLDPLSGGDQVHAQSHSHSRETQKSNFHLMTTVFASDFFSLLVESEHRRIISSVDHLSLSSRDPCFAGVVAGLYDSLDRFGGDLLGALSCVPHQAARWQGDL